MNQPNHIENLKPFIILNDAAVTCYDKIFFEHLNWVIESNQHWAIFGPNGTGKTILAKVICRNIPLQRGQIQYFFANNSDGKPFYNRGEIVMISPDHQKSLLQHYGGYHQSRWQSFEGDEVPTVAHYLSGSSIEHCSPYEVTPLQTDEAIYQLRRQKALELLGIESLLERKIHQLSNGETRKVLIARGLMQQPKLLILDDPYGGLDSSTRNILRTAIDKLLLTNEFQLILITSQSVDISDGISHILYIHEDQKIVQAKKEAFLTSKSVLTSKTLTEVDSTFSFPDCPDLNPHFELENPILVEMKNITVSYQGIKVLSNINWRINQGERWLIIGPNGAGKTTLLSLILADNPQSYSNEIYLFGRRRGSGESIWDIKQRIGWVSPELLLYYQTGQTCLEVVCSGFYDSMGLYSECTTAQLQKALDWLGVLKLNSFANLPFCELSMGEQRLILLVRALVKNPLLLILDEPCQGLDLHHQAQIIALLDQLCHQSRISMIYVTHQQSEIPYSITHLLKLKDGEISEIGPFGNYSIKNPT